MRSGERRDEIERRLGDVRGRIAAAAESVGRPCGDITLVVVTKTWPVADLRLLVELGVRDLGESRHQEAADKVRVLAGSDGTGAACASGEATPGQPLRWHFVGQLQSNKAARVAAYADLVHSVDSAKVARRLGAGAADAGRTVGCLVQVSLDAMPGKVGPLGPRGGVGHDRVEALAAAIDQTPGLELRGVMGVSPLDDEPLSAYRRLVDTRDRLLSTRPSAVAISAGMSGDFEAAIRAGATHVRVGSAVLGERARLR